MLRASSDPEVKKLRDEIELVPGMKINKLTLIRKEGSSWICDCDCGTKNFIVTRPYRLKNELIGNVKDHVGSCGCLQKKVFKAANRQGTVETKYQNITYSGLKILYRTDFIDSNRSTIVICECPKCKKPFPTTLRSGSINCGCAKGGKPLSIEGFILKDNYKSLGEIALADILKKNNISFIYDKKFQDCIDKTYLPFDFYILNKYLIEFDGEQHFKKVNFFNFELTHKHDLMKNKYCFEHNIPLIRIPYNAEYTIDDLKLETTRFLLTPENEEEYYKERM